MDFDRTCEWLKEKVQSVDFDMFIESFKVNGGKL